LNLSLAPAAGPVSSREAPLVSVLLMLLSQGAWGDADRDGVPNVYDRDSRFYDARAAYRHGGWGDADRDGVPNRYDRAPTNPYRR